MFDYEPLDLSAHVNAGIEAIPEAERDRVTVGAIELRGLPFLIAGGTGSPGESAHFVLPRTPTTIEVGRPARRLVFAHRQLEQPGPAGQAGPAGPAGHGIGTEVADYVFHLGNGSVVTVPIRERFEIHVTDHGWGQMPSLAVPDQHDSSLPRTEGPWGMAGMRLAEHHRGNPSQYYLWCWENPDPEETVERIVLVPKGIRFLVGGITVSNADESPFVREAARPVRITATGAEGMLDIDVDRGVATYPQPIRLGDDRVGWGSDGAAEENENAAYSNVAALPSATVTVRQGENDLGSVRWGDVERDGQASDQGLRVELVDPGRNWVHVTVVDDETGRPVPCRVHFRSPEGIPYQPHGHHNHVAQNLGSWHYDVGGDVRLGQTTYAYIDGTCQGWMPRGEVVVDVARGFEYAPLRQSVPIEPGQRELTLRLRRTADPRADGWWSGDSHVHFLSTAGAQLEQRGEDLAVVNLLQAQWGALFTNTEDFTGRPALVDGGEFVTYVGQENRQHFLGHSLLWGLKEPVMPWSADGPDEAELGGALDTNLSDWADRTHAQGGTVIAAHFPLPNGEPAVLVTTGRADAVEILSQSDEALLEYYTYLNAGYRLPLVGGTDKMSSSVPVGLYRTYAKLDGEFSYDAWCKAVRDGRTFLSGGPLLTFTVDGRDPGDTVDLTGPGTVHVDAGVTSIFPLRSLELVCNGEVIAQATPGSGGALSLALQEEVRIDGHSWLAVRAMGEDRHFDEWARQVFAHTSPVYVACGGEWGMANPEGLHYIRTVIECARTYVRHRAVRRDDRSTTFHHGGTDHLAWLERPFEEALRLLDERSGRS